MAEFESAVSNVEEGRVVIRGFSHEEIMRGLTYAQATFLTLVGRLPTPAEAKMTEVMLTSLLDHGFVSATTAVGRYIASGNPEFVPAVAGGLLAAGSNTLSPEHSYSLLTRALEMKQERGLTDQETAAAVIEELTQARKRVPGFGHPIHRDGDFRANVIFGVADELGLTGDATRLYRAIHAEFVAKTGRVGVPINIDGALACVGMDMGFKPHHTVSLALLGVLPGLMAHVIEEIESPATLRWITTGEYVGTAYQPLPSLPTNGSATISESGVSS